MTGADQPAATCRPDGPPADRPLAVGIDVGGTKIAGGVVDPAGRVLALSRADTPAADVARTRDVIVDLVRELAGSHPVVAVGIGAAGWVAAGRATVSYAPHLAWRDEPLRDRVAAAVDLPVVVENDANAAAWAEYTFGAACEPDRDPSGAGPDRDRSGAGPDRDRSHAGPGDLVLVTVGTGIGGGLVLGGELFRGAHGYAGEPGHQVVVPGGLPCGCGRRGCLERYASGEALVRYVRTGAAEHPAAGAALRALAGDPARLTGPQVTAAARAGDKLAQSAFDQVGRWLGVGLADLAQLLDPAVLVVGGGVAEAGELLLTPARQSYRDELGQRGRLPVAAVRAAQLGNLAGLVGAADLARREAA